jgi:hypothetical protein
MDSSLEAIKEEVEDFNVEHRPESEEINPMSAEDCEAFIKAKMEEGENEHDYLPENLDERCEVFIKEEVEVKAEPDFLADSPVSGAEESSSHVFIAEEVSESVISSTQHTMASSEGTYPLLR